MLKITVVVIAVSLATAEGDHVAAQRRFDDANEHFMAGYYQYAFEELLELAQVPEFALPAAIKIAECQLTSGNYEGALATLQSDTTVESARAISKGTKSPRGSLEAREQANWHRAMAATYFKLGQYEKAIEHGEQAIRKKAHHTRARYELGRIYEVLGRRDQALKTYEWFNDLLSVRVEFPTSPVDLHYSALGFYRYSVLSRHSNLSRRTKYVLHELLQKACMVVDLTYWPARLAIADLLREKYSLNEALEDYKAVLKQNPNCLQAHLGIGQIALEGWDFENVETRVAVCLDLNPRCVEAYVLLAGLRMIERRFEDAISAARYGLQINPHHIEALSYLAAAQMRAGQNAESQSTQVEVYRLSAAPAIMHTIIGKQLSDGRQFPEAEDNFKIAIELDPTNPTPRNELGMMYMQWGREDQARAVLDEAFEIDAFNVQTYNTSSLLDKLFAFAKHQTPHFDIHFNAKQDSVIGEYMGEYLESIYEELCDDYEIELVDRTIIEVFPDHRSFGVRIHGKPWIHTVGACTGRVIALDAPRRDVQGTYNYASVLRHEFTHTVTLAATENRIPHWLTEGLAVLQEDRPKAWSWRKLLTDALRRNQLFSLSDIDWGFIRPRRPDDRQLAYAQSEWMCEFIIETYGYDIFNKMIRRFRKGEVQRDVFPALTGASTQEFDRAFRQWAGEQAGSWGLPLDPALEPSEIKWLLRFYHDSADLRAKLAELLIDEEKFEEALQHARLALEIDSHHRGSLKMAARILFLLAGEQVAPEAYLEHLEAAKEFYERLARRHPDEAEAVEFLAQWALEHDDPDEAVRWAKILKRLQPLNPTGYRILSVVYLERDEDDLAFPELLELARHEDHNADVPRQIARIYNDRDKVRAASSWYRQSIHIDPYHVPTHQQYAKVLTELNEHEQAIREYRVITKLEPDEAKYLNELAFAYFRAGQRDRAKEVAQRAVELDPHSPARQLLQD